MGKHRDRVRGTVPERTRRPVISANHVTLARIAAMPVIVWLLYQGNTGRWWAWGIACGVAMTDFVDGYLARKYGPTVLGGLMDPIADKVFIAVLFLPPMYMGWFPVWPVVLIFLRELLVTALRTIYERRGIRFKTSYLAKVKTWFQMQGALTLMFFFMVADVATVQTTMVVATAVVVAAAIVLAVVQRRVRRGIAVMAVSMIAADVVLFAAGVDPFIQVMLWSVVAVTWASAFDYFAAALERLSGKDDFGVADVVRIVGAIALPSIIIAVLVWTRVPMWVPLSILAFELAVGGLDNLLAHHRVAASAVAWSLRTLGTAVCLAGALVFSRNGFTDTAHVLVFGGLAVSLVGGIREFSRGSKYYLETDAA